MQDPFSAPSTSPEPSFGKIIRPVRPFRHAFDPHRAIGNAWNAFTRFPFAVWLSGFVFLLADGLSDADTGFETSTSVEVDSLSSAMQAIGAAFADYEFGATFFGAVLLTVVLTFVYAFVRVGFLRHSARVTRSIRAEAATLLSGRDATVSMFVVGLLYGLIQLALAGLVIIPAYFAVQTFGESGIYVGAAIVLLGIVPWLYVDLGLSLAALPVALDGASPLDALRTSWRLVRGHRLRLFVFELLVVLVIIGAGLLGILMLGIGVLVTVPVAFAMRGIARAESYLLLTRAEPEWHRADLPVI